MRRYEPFAQNHRVLEWTEPTLGLPLITSKHNDANIIFDAVAGAIAQLTETDRQLLGLRSIVKIPKEKYLEAQNPL